jgi:hypothetical protein
MIAYATGDTVALLLDRGAKIEAEDTVWPSHYPSQSKALLTQSTYGLHMLSLFRTVIRP